MIEYRRSEMFGEVGESAEGAVVAAKTVAGSGYGEWRANWNTGGWAM